MADNEHRIVSKVMVDRDLRPLLDRGVSASWFFDPDHRSALNFILDHYTKYGSPPVLPTFRTHMGTTYKILGVTESLEYLLDAQADVCRWKALQVGLEVGSVALSDNNTREALEAIEKALAKAYTYQPTASHLINSMDDDRIAERWEDYELRERGGTIIGYTTGFPTIDETTLGLQPGQLVTVVAATKVGKTSLCLAIGNHVYVEYKLPILFVTFEMGVRELEFRQESLMAKINFRNLQSGTLSPIDRNKYEDYLDKAEDEYTWPFHFMDVASGSTVSAVQAQIERYDPGVVFLDGIYMMTDEVTGDTMTPQALTNITRSLKRMATKVGKPVVINTQALGQKMKGTRLDLNSIGYASSFAQDSDVVLGMERVKDEKGDDSEGHSLERILRVLASRNSGTTQVELVFDYSEGKIQEVTP